MNKYLFIVLLGYLPISEAGTVLNNSADKLKKEVLENGQLYINGAGQGFKCAGIEMFDERAAMDLPVYYADASSRKILCVWGMGGRVSADPNDSGCPPAAWQKNACDKKVEEVRRMQRERNSR